MQALHRSPCAVTRVRDLAARVVRIATYAVNMQYLSAEAALRQISMALKDNVLYLDRGWQTVVDGLAMRARSWQRSGDWKPMQRC
jgi:hypothetical protein